MTQQDEAGQRTSADEPVTNQEQASQPLAVSSEQAAPPRPSPYLEAGESVPQAYLAPPQPGQPRYGTPPAAGPGLRPQGYGRPGYGQGYGQPGQPGYGQRRYGRPGSARVAFAPRRDPVIAAPWERLLASILDWVVIIALSILLFVSPLLRIWREVEAVTANAQSLSTPAANAAMDAIARDPANQRALLFWFLSIFALALAWYWIQHAVWGATLGKRVLGMRVVSAADRSRISVRTAGIRAGMFLVGPAVFLLLPSPINLIGGALWLADAVTPLFDPKAQCLHDRFAGTIVVRQRLLDQQASRPSPW